MTNSLNGKTVVVTGGTGSFGNAVIKRLLREDAAEVRVFSRDEKKQDDMRRVFADTRVKFYIGDVRDYDSLLSATRGANLLFGAAALKQVPSCEFFPIEAVKTNVLGTYNTLRAANVNNLDSAVCLSTDKAVYPINAMGTSKAMMEKVMLSKSRNSACVMSATRYGNVLCSRGSVVPLFIEQIKSGKKITVTDPAMTRFVMTLEESVDLVLHAFFNAKPGDIFVQKAPAATIADLAQAVCELFGYKGEIAVIGTRHGEKQNEALVSVEELARSEDMGRYYRVRADNRDLNYNMYVSQGKSVMPSESYNSNNTVRLTVPQIKEILLTQPEVTNALSEVGL